MGAATCAGNPDRQRRGHICDDARRLLNQRRDDVLSVCVDSSALRRFVPMPTLTIAQSVMRIRRARTAIASLALCQDSWLGPSPIIGHVERPSYSGVARYAPPRWWNMLKFLAWPSVAASIQNRICIVRKLRRALIACDQTSSM